MEQLKIKASKESELSEQEMNRRISLVDNAIISIKSDLESVRSKLAKDVDFKSKANWYENGEKPTKYFLNLNKHYHKQKLINEISDDDKQYVGNNQVKEGIKNFYESLYKRNTDDDKIDIDESFFSECPRLRIDAANKVEEVITKDELFRALNSCKESAPGPDGIPYIVYKKLWNITGDFIHKAWLHSVHTNKLPTSHAESVITILPKEGKDLSKIKNWRPITLSNCDAKLITKALALRMAKILNEIVDPSQTAYVPGRSVMDNIRSNMYVKNYCKNKNIEGLLVSLDAKKAFDSVSHEYIEKVLERYGFGPNFRQAFKILYKDITARIMVNGFFSEKIRIERGVKQGDALSCAIFILCVDPLLRNLNKNVNIKGINLKMKTNSSVFQHKCSGYADDISIICRDTKRSLEAIFEEYQKLTKYSGLELNAEKTEILRLGTNEQKIFSFNYMGVNHSVTNVSKIKICGIYFSPDPEVENQHNVIDKIKKLECKLTPWIKRGLSLEGKILLVKTFGLSQLIYNMQCVYFSEDKIKEIERKIFGFIWSKRSTEVNGRTIDRIKRSVLKNEYSEGGLKATDVECLDRALKLRQYIRASKALHVINRIQIKCISDDNNCNLLQQDFVKISKNEIIVESAQTSLHKLIDFNRKTIIENSENTNYDKHTIDQIASINVADHLKRSNKTLALCIYNSTFKEYENLLEVVREAETEIDRKRSKILEMILSNFPKTFRQIALSFDDNVNKIKNAIEIIEVSKDNWVKVDNLTTKNIQIILKNALDKVSQLDVKQKNGIAMFDSNNFIKFRKQCKNTKMRSLYHRLTNNDFFSQDRMYRFKMTSDNKCHRCEEVETTKHLLWECQDSRLIWDKLNEILNVIGLMNEKMLTYEDLYKVTDNIPVTHIKMKIIQAMIQIDRPIKWNKHKVIELINATSNIEKYIAIKNKKLITWQLCWKKFQGLK
jgi:hypothetical protein